MLYFPRVLSRLIEREIIFVDPSQIKMVLKTKWLSTNSIRDKVNYKRYPKTFRQYQKIINNLDNIFWNYDECSKLVISIEHDDKYIKVKDLVDKRNDYKTSIMWKKYISDIDRDGYSYYKRIRFQNENQVNNFFEDYMLPLIESIEQYGVLVKDKNDLTRVFISKGSIVKSQSGSHRFYIAKALGLTHIPVSISGLDSSYGYCALFSKKIRHAILRELGCNLE